MLCLYIIVVEISCTRFVDLVKQSERISVRYRVIETTALIIIIIIMLASH